MAKMYRGYIPPRISVWALRSLSLLDSLSTDASIEETLTTEEWVSEE